MHFIKFLLVLMPCIVWAQTPYSITMINHFNTPLNFKITINPHVLPDLPKDFNLDVNNQITSKILDIDKESYIQVNGAGKLNAFWGVNIEQQQVKIHGYVSKGIAYSWNMQTITFCLPEEYKQYHRCKP